MKLPPHTVLTVQAPRGGFVFTTAVCTKACEPRRVMAYATDELVLDRLDHARRATLVWRCVNCHATTTPHDIEGLREQRFGHAGRLLT